MAQFQWRSRDLLALSCLSRISSTAATFLFYRGMFNRNRLLAALHINQHIFAVQTQLIDFIRLTDEKTLQWKGRLRPGLSNPDTYMPMISSLTSTLTCLIPDTLNSLRSPVLHCFCGQFTVFHDTAKPLTRLNTLFLLRKFVNRINKTPSMLRQYIRRYPMS